jgi:integrase
MSLPKSFPIEIKRKNVIVKIYRVSNKGYDEFRVIWYDAEGKRKMRSFSDYVEAEDEASKVGASFATGNADTLLLSRDEAAKYTRALEHLKTSGVSLDAAATQFADAYRLLEGRPLIEAVRYYAKKHPKELPRKTVAEVVEELIRAKTEDGASYHYLNDLKKLRIFARAFSCQLASVAGTQIDDWLRTMKVAGRTRNNYRLLIQTLFNFAKARRYLPLDHDEMSAVAVANEQNGEIEIFTPDELLMWITAADPHLVPFLVLGAFAGIRHWEIKRLDWSDIRLDRGFIEIKGGKSKTGSRRLVPITPNLSQWLAPYAKASGPVCSYSNMSEELMYLVHKVNKRRKRERLKPVAWKHNALRHSFISYRVAAIQNVNQVALEAGNSPAMIFKHYRELVTPEEAKAWFSITPNGAENVIPIAREAT